MAEEWGGEDSEKLAEKKINSSIIKNKGRAGGGQVSV